MSQSVPWNRFCGLILPFVCKPQWVYVGTEITLGETFVHLSRNQEEWVRLKQAESCLNDKCLYRTFCESCGFLPLASVFLDAFIHECLLYQPGTTWISHFLLVSCPFVPISLFLLILFCFFRVCLSTCFSFGPRVPISSCKVCPSASSFLGLWNGDRYIIFISYSWIPRSERSSLRGCGFHHFNYPHWTTRKREFKCFKYCPPLFVFFIAWLILGTAWLDLMFYFKLHEIRITLWTPYPQCICYLPVSYF